MIEIERKFLVSSEKFKEDATSKEKVVQGFLNTHPERTVRVRIRGNSAFLTLKGKSNESGTKRFEWEKEVTGHIEYYSSRLSKRIFSSLPSPAHGLVQVDHRLQLAKPRIDKI